MQVSRELKCARVRVRSTPAATVTCAELMCEKVNTITTVHVHIVWYFQYCGVAKRVIVTLEPCCYCLDARMLFDNTVLSHETKGVKPRFGDRCVGIS